MYERKHASTNLSLAFQHGRLTLIVKNKWIGAELSKAFDSECKTNIDVLPDGKINDIINL